MTSAIKQGRFLLNYDASWIEQGSSGYTFCAIAKSRTPKCERLDIPLLQGTRLLYADDGVRKPLLTLAFNKLDNGPDAVQRNTIGKRFVEAFVRARNSIVARNQIVPAKATVSARIMFSTTSLLDEGGCETAICDGPDGGGSGGGVGGGVGGGGGWADIDPYFDPWGGFAPNPACVVRCTAVHDAGAVYCGTLPDLRLKAICYAGNMTVYGGCLAGC